MSKRLQVVLDDADYRDLKKAARTRGLTLSQWVRQTLRTAGRQEPRYDVARKLAAIREGLKHSYPTGDIEQILEETERGYLETGE